MAKKQNINHYCGDTYDAFITIENYVPTENDEIKFGLKKDKNATECLIEKTIDPLKMVLHLNSEDTQELDEGSYPYDMQVTFVDEENVSHTKTFVYGTFKLTKDVVR